MAKNKQENFQKRRLLTGYLYVVFSITFALFFVGVLGLILVNSKKVAEHFKEQITLTVYLNKSAKDVEIKQLQKKISLNPRTKKVVFISKESAAEYLAADIGEDFIEFLGYNPLLNSIDVNFNADFVNVGSIRSLQIELELNDFVDEVVFDQPLVVLLEENIEEISIILLLTTALFVFIALLSINSSIRLSIYSKRFIIKTMQLVGATKSFIRKPIIWSHLRLGILSSLLAAGTLSVLFVEVNKRFPELEMLANPIESIVVLGGLVTLGIIITVISTFFATQRYLNLKTEAIY